MNPLELLTPDQIGSSGEKILPYNTDTVRRWVRDSALVVHELRDDGITQLITRGAAIVRVGVITELRKKPAWRKTSIASYGLLLADQCGADDTPLLERIKNDESLADIKNEIVQIMLHLKASA